MKIDKVNERVDLTNKEIENVKERLNTLENSNAQTNHHPHPFPDPLSPSPSTEYVKAIKEIDHKIQRIRERSDKSKKENTKEAKKIVGIAPITDEDLEHYKSKGISDNCLLIEAVFSFLAE